MRNILLLYITLFCLPYLSLAESYSRKDLRVLKTADSYAQTILRRLSKISAKSATSLNDMETLLGLDTTIFIKSRFISDALFYTVTLKKTYKLYFQVTKELQSNGLYCLLWLRKTDKNYNSDGNINEEWYLTNPLFKNLFSGKKVFGETALGDKYYQSDSILTTLAGSMIRFEFKSDKRTFGECALMDRLDVYDSLFLPSTTELKDLKEKFISILIDSKTEYNEKWKFWSMEYKLSLSSLLKDSIAEYNIDYDWNEKRKKTEWIGINLKMSKGIVNKNGVYLEVFRKYVNFLFSETNIPFNRRFNLTDYNNRVLIGNILIETNVWKNWFNEEWLKIRFGLKSNWYCNLNEFWAKRLNNLFDLFIKIGNNTYLNI